MKKNVLCLASATLLAAGGGIVVAAPASAADVEVPVVVLGTLPGPTTPEAAADVDVPDPLVFAEKATAEVNVASHLTLLLVEGATAPVPTESAVPVADDGGGGGGSTPPSALRLSVRGAYQSTNYRCVPASGQTMLQTMGVSVSQGTLANEMHTTTNGTYMSNAVGPINRRQSRNRYMFLTDTANANHLFRRIVVDVYNYRSSLMLGIQMASAPWLPSGKYVGNHAIVTYGYYSSSGGGAYVWDPYNATYFGGSHNYGGSHAAPINGLWTSNASNSAQMVW